MKAAIVEMMRVPAYVHVTDVITMPWEDDRPVNFKRYPTKTLPLLTCVFLGVSTDA